MCWFEAILINADRQHCVHDMVQPKELLLVNAGVARRLFPGFGVMVLETEHGHHDLCDMMDGNYNS